jgi:hypothetical protein
VLAVSLATIYGDSTTGGYTLPEGPTYGFLDINGTIQTCPNFVGGYPIQQGTSVGQLFDDMVAADVCDIVMEPIYEPIAWPGTVSRLNIYAPNSGGAHSDQADPTTGFNYNAIFAWDRPGRSIVGLNRLQDGAQRATRIQFFNGQGGAAVYNPANPGTQFGYYDVPSLEKYGGYYAQQFFPGTLNLTDGSGQAAVRGIAESQLALRKGNKTTVNVNPAPERSPTPFIDYDLGDRVPVYAGKDLSPVNEIPNQFRQELFGYQRIVEIPIEIDDNGNETVRQLIVGPAGEIPAIGLLAQTTASTSSISARAGKRVGTVRVKRTRKFEV